MEDDAALVDEIIRAYEVFGIDPLDGADEFGVGAWLEKLHPRDRLGQWREVLARLLKRDGEKRAAIDNEDISPAEAEIVRTQVGQEAKTLMEKLREGGFTYHIPTGNYPAHGNSVAVSGFGKTFDNIDDVTEQDVEDYALANYEELTKDEARHLGAWKAGNKVFLDVAEVVDDTPEEALDRARSRGEIASFDLATFKEDFVKYYKDDPPPSGSPAAIALAYPEGHDDKIHWAGDVSPTKKRKR